MSLNDFGFLVSNIASLADWRYVTMWVIGGLLIFLAIKYEMEPTLLLPLGFGTILVNIPFSGAINRTLENGEVERANAFLGHPHTLSDTVHYGYRLGTKMGTPTINMQFPDGVLVPRHGVYAAKVYLDDGSEHYAVTNVGVRPTVSGGQRVSVESFILDYHGNLYNRQVRLEFYKFLRPEQKFNSLEDLKAAILKNAEQTREIVK